MLEHFSITHCLRARDIRMIYIMNGFRSVRSFSSSLNIKIIIYVYIVGCFERGSLVIQRQNTHKIDEHDTNE